MSIALVMLSSHLILLTPLLEPALKLSQHQGLFQWVSCSYQMTKILELQLQDQSFHLVFRVDSLKTDWFDLPAVQGTLQCLVQHHGSKTSIFRRSAFFIVQLSQLYVATGKTKALTIWTFVGRVMSLLSSTLSRFVIAFLPRSKHLLISRLQSPSTVVLEPKKRKSVTTSTLSPSYLPWSNGARYHDLSFFNI